MNSNVILVGFMGVGKGRTARALASVTGQFAIDTDDLIESYLKMKIRNFFAQQGEAAFRKVEQDVADWLEHAVSDTIISTGGGFFNVNNLSQIGTVVYLHSSLKGILSAMQAHPKAAKKIKKRPLLQDLAKAEELFATRLPLYRAAADLEINVEGRRTSEIATDLCRVLQQKGVIA